MAALQCLTARVLRTHRQADEHLLLIELRHDVLEHVPGRRVRPLHVVEHHDDRVALPPRDSDSDDLIEQRVLVATRLRPASERRHQSRQLAPSLRRNDAQLSGSRRSPRPTARRAVSRRPRRTPGTSDPARRRTSLMSRRTERRLADAGLADDGHQVRPALHRRLEQPNQPLLSDSRPTNASG